jgi:CRP-like cAMP-binding protein
MREIENRTLASTLFHLLSDEEWASPRAWSCVPYMPGDVLVEQERSSRAVSGRRRGSGVGRSDNNHGERRELGRLGFGECIGEMSLLTGDPASADVVAATPVRTYAATPTRLAGLGELIAADRGAFGHARRQAQTRK